MGLELLSSDCYVTTMLRADILDDDFQKTWMEHSTQLFYSGHQVCKSTEVAHTVLVYEMSNICMLHEN